MERATGGSPVTPPNPSVAAGSVTGIQPVEGKERQRARNLVIVWKDNRLITLLFVCQWGLFGGC